MTTRVPPKRKADAAEEGICGDAAKSLNGLGTKHKNKKPRQQQQQQQSEGKAPKTALGKVVAAIRALGKPSSPQAILKCVADKFAYDNAPVLKRAMKAAEGKELTKMKASYWVAADPVPTAASGPQLTVEVLRVGTSGSTDGLVVEVGDDVAIDYELRLAAEPDNVVEAGKSFKFTVGGGEVIKGMDRGVRGMVTGERRRITVPWSLGYGKRGSMPDIPPEADLVFTITLRAQTKS